VEVKQKIFLRNNGETEKFQEIPLVDSERVVRPEKRKKIKDSASVTMIDKRIKNLKKWLEMPSLNSKNIIFSGIFDKLQDRENEKGKLEKNDYITIGNDFGISANRYSYLKEIYGSFKIAENVNTEFLELAEIIEDKKMLVEEEEDTFLESDFENISLVEKKTPNNKSSNIKKAKKAQLPGNHKKDYIKEQIKKNKIGKIGEQLVIKYERKMLEQMGRQDLSKRVSWASEEKGDNLGYDIKSFIIENGKEKEIVIEVKSTTGPAGIPFEITRKEVEVSEEIDEYYFIYRVFGIKKSKKNIGFYKVRGKVTRSFDLEPQIYIASVKSLNSHQRSTDN